MKTKKEKKKTQESFLIPRDESILLHPQGMVKTIKFSLQLVSVQEVVFTTLHPHRRLFWRSFLTGINCLLSQNFR